MIKKETEARIGGYFEACEGKLAIDEETGLPMTAKRGGYVYEILPKTPTLTGLALALGMLSKQELFQALKTEKKETRALLKKAVSRVEENAERRLIESGAGGVRFFLSSNFDGWDEEEKGEELPIELLSGVSTDELKQIMKKADCESDKQRL